jgi:uncharacterized protein YdcH (DUF465 family)
MRKDSRSVEDHLLKENEEFRRLARKHRELDERITGLTRRFLLSKEEKSEEVTLKKKKLALKDKMAILIRKQEIENEACNGKPSVASA